jgi:HEAT repeat protein
MRGELKGMRQLVALSLLQQDSAADRLRGVTWSAGIDRPGGEVVSALLETLQHDANVNVRLAAIDALRGLGGAEPRVRDALVGGLKNDPSPLVQVALIDALVTLRERKSADVLRTIAESPTANEAVRQRARRGLEQLL